MSKLLCIFVDGLRTDTLACAHVRSFNQMIANGTLCRNLQVPTPSLLLPTLLSLFTSLPPTEHGITTNSGSVPPSPHACSLLTLLRYRQYQCAAFYSNDRLRLAFPCGTLQTACLINSQGIQNVDNELAFLAGNHLQKEKPDLCFLYLQGADIAGIHFGFFSEPYLESIEQADQILGFLLEQLAQVGLEQEYTVMIIGNPGGFRANKSSMSTDTPNTPLLIAGPGICANQQLNTAINYLDLAPTMMRILGLAQHPDWRGQAIEELWQRPALELLHSDSLHHLSPHSNREGLAA